MWRTVGIRGEISTDAKEAESYTPLNARLEEVSEPYRPAAMPVAASAGIICMMIALVMSEPTWR
jgi:hypothetical protein